MQRTLYRERRILTESELAFICALFGKAASLLHPSNEHPIQRNALSAVLRLRVEMNLGANDFAGCATMRGFHTPS